ncbi:energy-coupling factor transporter ATP-binding protein EcfA2 [Lactobacillus colini]|uniref:Energy-coupling factor transporter ATP-binding protein EcfA2 n=1 Tax=Lactobacillus colini TaxID=1819254 RepID=A0ABS4MCB9_9LACO|nr:AAA family ATPase [Lactobacillus colini]MBP2057296.1 energy-coupling factor transporter ATP-binding protein EcfA2 [Lactobacillus colini]
MKNPFNPSFGKIPSIFLNRDSLTSRVVTELKDGDSPFQTSLIYGQRGSGKTTLMTNFANILNQKEDWLVIDLVLDDDLLDSLINQLRNRLANHTSLQNLDLKLGIGGLGVNAQFSKNNPQNFQSLFEKYLSQLNAAGIQVLINIDEIETTSQLRKLVSCYQVMLRKNLKVSLLMAGLPENVSELQNDKVLTFLLRANRIVLTPLSATDIMESYRCTFENDGYHISHETLLYMTKQTLGFAYAFQLLGYYVWRFSQENKIKEITIQSVQAILDDYVADLNRNVYFKIYNEMSNKEQQFVQAMATIDKPKIKVQHIGQIMGKPANYISVYRKKLIDNQVIKSSGYGYVSFILPYFDQYVKDQILLDLF